MSAEPLHKAGSQRSALAAVLVTGLIASALLSVMAVLMRGRAGPPVQPGRLELSILLPSFRSFRMGERLTYAFDWNGIPGARAWMGLKEEVKDGARWIVLEYEGRTAVEIAWAWDYRVSGTAYLDPQTLLPAVSTVTSTKKGKTKRSTTRFDRSAGVAETVTEKLYRGTSSTERVPFRQGLDLPTALLLMRTLELRAGESVTVEVLQSDKAYAVTLTAGAVETVSVRAGSFEAVPVDVRVEAQGSSGQGEARSEYRAVRVWLSAQGHVPLKMEAQVTVGRVRAELVSVETQ